MELLCWKSLSENQRQSYLSDVREVFYESSTKKDFTDEEEKEAFFEKWLGSYIELFEETFFIAIEEDSFLGYIIACPDSLKHPELSQPEVGNEKDYKDFPAHLHINCHHRSRGKGVGGQLLNRLENFCREENIPGIHLITLEGERNVGFYQKNGYQEIRSKKVGDKTLLMLGKNLQ